MSLQWLKFRRWRLKKRNFDEPFNRLLNTPMPAAGATFNEIEFLSLDIETTGLDANKADMLSTGWVVIIDGHVDLSTAESYVVRPSGAVGSSASVHGLTDTVVESGSDWATVLSRIVEVAAGRVLLVHHAGLDKVLLDRLCRELFAAPLLVPVVDTLALEKRRQQRRHHVDEKRSLRLAELRSAYGLPRYNAHDSLVDAIATAELLIAMVAHNGGANRTRLRDLEA